MDKSTGPVVAGVFASDFTAHIAVGVLAEHGIRAGLENEIMNSVFQVGNVSWGGVRLIVNPQDLEKAVEIIEEVKRNVGEDF